MLVQAVVKQNSSVELRTSADQWPHQSGQGTYTRSVDETSNYQRWPALEKDDAGLKKELEELLTGRAVGDPYS
jgi:hypothetical protein